tara:strand:- start:799 stop:1023 length:225 start_codon:yes stop_codon:yes gene_type:complete
MNKVEQFIDGFNYAIKDMETNEIYDIELAIEGFKINPATSCFQSGYLDALLKINKRGLKTTRDLLISGEIRKLI